MTRPVFDVYRYRKVLRSKDLSSASREELDCVLGRRRRREREGRGGGEGEKEGEERGRAKRKKTENAAEYEVPSLCA